MSNDKSQMTGTDSTSTDDYDIDNPITFSLLDSEVILAIWKPVDNLSLPFLKNLVLGSHLFFSSWGKTQHFQLLLLFLSKGHLSVLNQGCLEQVPTHPVKSETLFYGYVQSPLPPNGLNSGLKPSISHFVFASPCQSQIVVPLLLCCLILLVSSEGALYVIMS